jgi:hypothetical protein
MAMQLTGPENASFALHIVGYEFPELQYEPYDSDWLVIAVSVTMARGTWRATHSCLLTWEVARLATWFDAIAAHAPVEPEESFVEPNLRFHLLQSHGSSHHLRVYFELESRPAWAAAQVADMEDLWVDLNADTTTLQAAAAALRAAFEEFSVRVGW